MKPIKLLTKELNAEQDSLSQTQDVTFDHPSPGLLPAEREIYP
jgi:hypothetical protein